MALTAEEMSHGCLAFLILPRSSYPTPSRYTLSTLIQEPHLTSGSPSPQKYFCGFVGCFQGTQKGRGLTPSISAVSPVTTPYPQMGWDKSSDREGSWLPTSPKA